MDTLKGAAQSKTVWAALLLEILSQLSPLMDSYLALWNLDSHTIKLVGGTISLIMLVLRIFTSQSLAMKAQQANVWATLTILSIFATVGAMSGCASVQNNFNTGLNDALLACTTANNTVDTLLTSGLITSVEAKNDETIITDIEGALQIAASYEASNPTTAAAKLAAAVAAIAALTAYLATIH